MVRFSFFLLSLVVFFVRNLKEITYWEKGEVCENSSGEADDTIKRSLGRGCFYP
jgi:hypothetical protein